MWECFGSAVPSTVAARHRQSQLTLNFVLSFVNLHLHYTQKLCASSRDSSGDNGVRVRSWGAWHLSFLLFLMFLGLEAAVENIPWISLAEAYLLLMTDCLF